MLSKYCSQNTLLSNTTSLHDMIKPEMTMVHSGAKKFSLSASGASFGETLASRGYFVHLAMYGLSLMNELNDLRR